MRPFQICVLLCMACVGLSAAYLLPGERDRCFCEINGAVDDCCCDFATVDTMNANVIGPRLRALLKRQFFRLIQINLKRPCPFYRAEGKCLAEGCDVTTCADDEVPDAFRNEDVSHVVEQCSDIQESKVLGNLDTTISVDDKRLVHNWSSLDNMDDTFCELDDDDISFRNATFVDLLRNPERFTGYSGDSAHSIWRSIYEENCFDMDDHNASSAQLPTYSSLLIPKAYAMNQLLPKTCVEKRIFYRLLSGMHASINIHLSADYLLDRGKDKWGPNIGEFTRRFGPTATQGEGPTWLKNVYTLYALVLRAVVKAKPVWERHSFVTGDLAEDAKTKELMQSFLADVVVCPSTFDEKTMFSGDPVAAKELKAEFRSRFRNITRIMDCVGCSKCKLWGKVQTLGIATALKILFIESELGHDAPVGTIQKTLNLRRTEVVALFNALGQLSKSLDYLETFRSLRHGGDPYFL